MASQPLTTFPAFSTLPIEIRLKIWAFASNQSPRILDIWTDFTSCSVGNSNFMAQSYSVLLSPTPPPAILHASKEAREEGLEHYTLEFRTDFNLPDKGISLVHEPRTYINYASDLIVPCGHWNVVSFGDFARRWYGQLGHLAMDVRGSFWRDNVKEYVEKGQWLFPGVKEIVLFDRKESEGAGCFAGRDGEGTREFRKIWEGGKRHLDFVELESQEIGVDGMEGSAKDLENARRELEGYFDAVQGKVEGEVVVAEDDESKEDGVEELEFLERPRVLICKLEMRDVDGI
jgi:hypothetical protein